MKLTPDDFVYDLSDDLEPGWQTMEVLKQWTKEVTTKDPSGNTATTLWPNLALSRMTMAKLSSGLGLSDRKALAARWVS